MVRSADHLRSQRRQPDASRSAARNGRNERGHQGHRQWRRGARRTDRNRYDGDRMVQPREPGQPERSVQRRLPGRGGKSGGRPIRRDGGVVGGAAEPDQRRTDLAENRSAGRGDEAAAIRAGWKLAGRAILQQSRVGDSGSAAAERLGTERDRCHDFRQDRAILRRADPSVGSPRQSCQRAALSVQPDSATAAQRGGDRSRGSDRVGVAARLRTGRVAGAPRGSDAGGAASGKAGDEQRDGTACGRLAGLRVRRRLLGILRDLAAEWGRAEHPRVGAQHR